MRTRTCDLYQKRTLPIVVVLLSLLPLLAVGQGLRYADILRLQEAVDSFSAVEGLSGKLTMTHANPDDTRSFQVFVQSPKEKIEVKINDTGTFRLPAIPADDREKARIIHTLEKGALSFSFMFGFQGPMPSKDATVFEFCQVLAGRMGRVLKLVCESLPEMADLQVAMVGIAIRTTEPAEGKVFLKKGNLTVASANLAKTGETIWMFDKYDPQEHRIVWEPDDIASQDVQVIFKSGGDASGVKNAIYVPRTEQELAQFSEPAKPASLPAGPIQIEGTTNLTPETNRLYTLLPPMLYKSVQPGPKQETVSRAWNLANEFVFRTALRFHVEMPAMQAAPHKTGVTVAFRVKDTDRKVQVFVRSDMRTIEYRE